MFSARKITYKQSGYFSRIITDYLEGNHKLRNFYSFDVNLEGLKAAIEKKQQHPVDRELLVSVLRDQYRDVNKTAEVSANIEKLLTTETFTICTAHQPNLFTGPLYFIYKILHAIKLAEYCKENFPEFEFVPIYYMGSEDADLEELNHFIVNGKKYEWNTSQSGAVGRMKVDKKILLLIEELEQQLGVEKFGQEVISLLRSMYTEGKTIMQATLELVNELFGTFGMVVLLPDDGRLKAALNPVFEDDLFRHIPSSLVNKTCNELSSQYNVQAKPREINLFYLKDDIRERFDKVNGNYVVNNSGLSFSPEEVKLLLKNEPAAFSPNVILRGLFQESILPDIAFIGGGGEIAYWLQFKEMFDHYSVPFPMLVLRNSFLVAEKKWMARMNKTNFSIEDFFQKEKELIDRLVKQLSLNEVSLNGSYKKTEELFTELTKRAGAIDSSLEKHVAALKKRSIHNLVELEKKMLRSEKRKHTDRINQLKSIREALFPENGLQERVENFSGFYAKWGRGFIDMLYKNSLTTEQEFTILTEQVVP
jgi:bacillithiol synthase